MCLIIKGSFSEYAIGLNIKFFDLHLYICCNWRISRLNIVHVRVCVNIFMRSLKYHSSVPSLSLKQVKEEDRAISKRAP